MSSTEIMPGHAVITSNYTSKPLGYNIAVARESHKSLVSKNICIGASGDPGIYIGNANDVLIEENDITRATFGISVGEDGPAIRCVLKNNRIHDNTWAPLLFNQGYDLTITGNTIEQYTFSSAYEGKGKTNTGMFAELALRRIQFFLRAIHLPGISVRSTLQEMAVRK